MVRLRKGLWFLLIVFLAYFSSPGYPAVKSIKVRNLPANQDMDRKEWNYKNNPLTLGVSVSDGDCIEDCLSSLNEAAKCNKCVDLQNACPDCCLKEDASSGEQKVRCPELDDDDKHICGADSFYKTECDLEDCESKKLEGKYYDNDNCKMKCSDYPSYKSGSKCDGTKGTGGKLKDNTKRPYGLQRAGCPDEDSGLLAPDNNNCTLKSGSGLDRIWKCPSDGIEPKFAKDYVKKALCVPNSNLTFINSKPDSSWGYGDYYAVTRVDPACGQSYECSGSCSIKVCLRDNDGYCARGNECTPNPSSCAPQSCHTNEEPVCAYSCVPGTACTAADTSTHDCECENSRQEKCGLGSCEPLCSGKGCEKSCESSCAINSCQSVSSPYYVYTLSQKYKDYLTKCIEKADEYEKCVNELDCCKDGVCPKKTDEEKTDVESCDPGFDANCDLAKCEKMACYSSDCESYTGVTKEKSCAQLASDANGCLVGKSNCEDFKAIDEIDPDNPGVGSYDFVARSGDSLTIIWQIDAKSSNNDVEGVNFYTLVKIFKLDVNKNPTGNPVHTSMMNVKSLEANFTIYGTTSTRTRTDGEELQDGKSYRARVYYFLPDAEFCKEKCETCAAANEVELSYISLTLVKVRE